MTYKETGGHTKNLSFVVCCFFKYVAVNLKEIRIFVLYNLQGYFSTQNDSQDTSHTFPSPVHDIKRCGAGAG